MSQTYDLQGQNTGRIFIRHDGFFGIFASLYSMVRRSHWGGDGSDIWMRKRPDRIAPDRFINEL